MNHRETAPSGRAAFKFLLTACAVLVAGYIGGRMGSRPATVEAEVPAARNSATETVIVGRGDIVATTSIEGYIEANSLFTIESSNLGIFEPAHLKRNDAVERAETIATVNGDPVTVPVEATFVKWLAIPGTEIPAGLPVAQFRLNGFGVAAEISGYEQYRFFSGIVRSRGQIYEGPGPFDCPIIQLPSDMGSSDGGDGARRFTCVIPIDIRIFEGAKAVVMIEGDQATDILLVPVQAVSGSVDQGEVTFVANDGSTRRRTIKLGISDGAFVEVKSGLKEGDKIVAEAPMISGASQ